jgi:hypothetical protein
MDRVFHGQIILFFGYVILKIVRRKGKKALQE